jgi:hypothetical protein
MLEVPRELEDKTDKTIGYPYEINDDENTGET